MRTKAFILLTAAAVMASPAAAALYVVGSASVLTDTPLNLTNADFLQSIAPKSGSIVIDGSQSTLLAKFFNSVGDASHRVTTGAAITPQLLSGAGLFIDLVPTAGFTKSETAALHTFLHNGGSVLLAGSNSLKAVNNGYINTLLTNLHAGIQLQSGSYAWDGGTATSGAGVQPQVRFAVLGASTGGLHYRSASTVTGGNALYTIPGAGSLVAEISLVPEVSEWATLAVGFAVLGMAARRRRWPSVAA